MIKNRNQQNKKQTIEKISGTKIWFFDKIDKIDKPLANRENNYQFQE